MKAFTWIRIVLGFLGIVAKRTKTKKDDEAIGIASGVTEVIANEMKEKEIE